MNKGQFDALLEKLHSQIEELQQIKEMMRKFNVQIELPKPMTAPNNAAKPGNGTQSTPRKRGRPKKAT